MAYGTRKEIADNVTLWFSNDYGMYMEATDAIARYGVEKATDYLYTSYRNQSTPDGAPYRKYAIREALHAVASE